MFSHESPAILGRLRKSLLMVEECLRERICSCVAASTVKSQEMKKGDGDGARLALERHYHRAKLHGHQLQLEPPVLHRRSCLNMPRYKYVGLASFWIRSTCY